MSKHIIINILELKDYDTWLRVLETADGETSVFCYKNNYNFYTGKNKTWLELFNYFLEISPPLGFDISAEMFIRLVEQHLPGTEITSNIIKKLTNITDNDISETGLGNEINFDSFIAFSNIERYRTYITYLLNFTKDYNTLLTVNPSDFNLKDGWYSSNNPNINTRHKLIVESIFFNYFDAPDIYSRPSVRDIAEYLNAPYSVILEASNFKTPRQLLRDNLNNHIKIKYVQ